MDESHLRVLVVDRIILQKALVGLDSSLIVVESNLVHQNGGLTFSSTIHTHSFDWATALAKLTEDWIEQKPGKLDDHFTICLPVESESLEAPLTAFAKSQNRQLFWEDMVSDYDWS